MRDVPQNEFVPEHHHVEHTLRSVIVLLFLGSNTDLLLLSNVQEVSWSGRALGAFHHMAAALLYTRTQHVRLIPVGLYTLESFQSSFLLWDSPITACLIELSLKLISKLLTLRC